MKRHALPVAVISLMTLFSTGCSSLHKESVPLYGGPELALSQVASVFAPEEIELMAMDGKDLGNHMFGTRETRFTVLPGDHVLTVRYSGFFQIDSENHDVIRSRPVALRFNAVAGETYHFEYAHPRTREAANAFAKEASFALVGERTGARFSSQVIRSYAEASLMDTITKAFSSDDASLAVRASALPESQVQAQSATQYPAQTIQPLAVSQRGAVVAAPTAVAAPRLQPTSSVHYDLLRDIWLRASPEERARFQTWTQSPEARR